MSEVKRKFIKFEIIAEYLDKDSINHIAQEIKNWSFAKDGVFVLSWRSEELKLKERK